MLIVTKIFNKLSRIFYYRNPVNVYLGRMIYGNNSGFLANIVGVYILWRDRKRSGLVENFNDDILDKASMLKETGWISLGEFASMQAVTTLKSKLDKYSSKLDIPRSYRLEFSSEDDNAEFYNQFPEVKELLNTQISDVIRCYYRSHFQVLNVHIYRTFSIPEKHLNVPSYEAYGSTEYWHNDGTTVESIKLFVLLDEVSESHGPLHIISIQDTKELMRKGFRKHIEGRSNSIIERKFSIFKFTGSAGSMLLANTNTCLHRADIPKHDLHRDMLVFYITTASKPLSVDWEKNAMKRQFLGIKRIFSS